MGEFKDQSLWMKLAFLMTCLGITLVLFGFASGMGGAGGAASEACFVIGFLCFLVACILVLGIVYLDPLGGNKAALISFIVFAFVAGVATIIGIALWGGRGHGRGNNNYVSSFGTYPAMLGALAGLLGILAGIFGVLDLVGVGAK